MNLPTKITVVRLALIPFMIVSFCLESLFPNWMYIITGAIFIIASMTDFLDGYLARKYKMVTTLGKFLDPIADKILVLVGLIVCTVSDSVRLNVPYLVMICSIIILSREFIISLFRQIAASKNIVLAADGLGKFKTGSTMTALGAMLWIPFPGVIGRVFWWMAIISLPIATIITIISGINYIVQNKAVLREEKSKVEMIKDEEIEFPDDLVVDAVEACFKENTYGLPFIQKTFEVPYSRAFKICFWIEMMEFVKIENNKKVISVTQADIDALREKKARFDKEHEEVK